MSWTETFHANADALAREFAATLEAAIDAALAERGHAMLALAGGGTPLPAYRLLAQARLDWSSVTLVPTDERWVEPGHAASNAGQLRQAFAVARGARCRTDGWRATHWPSRLRRGSRAGAAPGATSSRSWARPGVGSSMM
jgi:hypothetical protein